MGTSMLLFCLLPSLYVSYVDFKERRITNVVNILLFLVGIACSIVYNNLVVSCLGAAVFFALGLIFFMTGGVGAGDVKYGVTLGLWLGISGSVLVFTLSMVLYSVWAIFRAIRKDGPQSIFKELEFEIKSLVYLVTRILKRIPGITTPVLQKPESPYKALNSLPFAPCLALATWVFWFLYSP